ncbi:hypothetical protein Tco_0084296 [Tanacetum coccineum]
MLRIKNDLKNQSSKKKSAQTSKGKRLKISTKVAKPAKKKQPATTSKAKGLNVLSAVALSETKQMKLVTKKSKTQFHSSHASGSGADEGTSVSPRVPDVPTYNFENEQISWKSSDEDNDDEANMSENDDDQNNDNADNEGDDDQDDDNEQTESDNDEMTSLISRANDEKERMDEEETNEEEEANELYRDVNVNLEGRDTTMMETDIRKGTKNQSPKHQNHHGMEKRRQAKVKVNQNRVKVLEDDFSEFKQTNLFDEAVSSISDIINQYLANKMNKAVKTAVQLHSHRLRDEAQAENEDFINTLDENMRKIIKNQVKEQVKEQVSKILPKNEKTINEQLEAEVLTCSSNKAKTSHTVAANLSELDLKKILIDKMENILETYGDTVTFKKTTDDEDEDEEPSVGSNRGSKRRRVGKEPESTSALKEKTSKSTGKSKEGSKSHQTSTSNSAQAEEPIHADENLEEPAHQEFDIGFTKDQPVDETTQHPDWFQKPTKPRTPDRDWNKALLTKHGPGQPWISTLARNEDPRESFNELTDDTPLRTSHIRDESFGSMLTANVVQEALSSEGTPYTTYSNPKGFIYQNKDKKNRLMRIDELHKFSDGTLNDVRSALDDILKRIRLEYLPQTVWRNVDRERAGAMIQAINSPIDRNKRLLRSLGKFVGGRLYGGDLRLL